MGNSYFFRKLVIGFGYRLDLLTISLETREQAEIILFPKLRFILLHSIVDMIVFFVVAGTTFTVS